MNRVLLHVLASLATIAGLNCSSAALVVVPNDLASVEGNGNNLSPFGNLNFVSSMRYQQVYAASQFNALNGPQLITQIAFRQNGVSDPTGAFDDVLPNIQLVLSTTEKAPGFLSNVFAENLGSSSTVVHSGALPLSSVAHGDIDAPRPFDILINLQTPFVYNPAAGNLLLDVRNFSKRPIGAFDADDSQPGTASRVFAGDVNATEASTFGAELILVTRFTMSPVPEPCGYAGLGLAVAALGIVRRLESPRFS